ncbi:cytidylyltransferase domain-containing protein [Chloroflexota bacterium]
MIKRKNVVAVIPARGGSKGLPGKNIKSLLGKPLIQYTITPALEAKLLDRVIVSTDDEMILSTARELGAEVPFIRPASLAQDTTTTEAVLKHTILWLKENEDYTVDILVYLQVPDLFKKAEWIDKAVQMLLDDTKLESAFVVQPEHKNYWIKESGRYIRLTSAIHMPRQLKEPIFREDTGLACATRAHLLVEHNRRVGDKVDLIVNRDFVVDIHTEFDFWLAEKLLQERPEYSKYLL